MSSQPGGYQGQPGYSQYPPDQYGQQYMGSSSYPPSRPIYPVYPSDVDRYANLYPIRLYRKLIIKKKIQHRI